MFRFNGDVATAKRKNRSWPQRLISGGASLLSTATGPTCCRLRLGH